MAEEAIQILNETKDLNTQSKEMTNKQDIDNF